jgi:hypothetical protein
MSVRPFYPLILAWFWIGLHNLICITLCRFILVSNKRLDIWLIFNFASIYLCSHVLNKNQFKKIKLLNIVESMTRIESLTGELWLIEN